METEFVRFNSIPRLTRDCTITEKLDGSNAQIYITDDFKIYTGSRNRFITIEDDHVSFAKFVKDNENELIEKLGPGRHFGEWWGFKIQRGYGLKERKFSLFNTKIWSDYSNRPSCCDVVPILYEGVFDTTKINETLDNLKNNGSVAAPGYMNPEGIIIYHHAANMYFKKTIDKDEVPKSLKGK